MKITKKQAKELINQIVGDLDYDLAKTLDPETAEEPEAAVEKMNELVKMVQEFLSGIENKK